MIPLAHFMDTRWRSFIAFVLIGILTAYLLIEFLPLAPSLADWKPFDYGLYYAWGRALVEGTPTYAYPLPTIFWVFAPLSLLPEWFAIVWAAAPFVFILYIFGRRGVVLWLFFPLLVQTAYAQLDGWLILPMLWLVQDRPLIGPLSGVLLLLKPTLAPLAILFAIFRWVRMKNWRSLTWFSIFLVVYELPALIIDPQWMIRFLNETPARATQSNMIPRGASLWAWWWHGGITAWLLPLVVLLVLGLTVYIARRTSKLTTTAELLNLIGLPFLYSSNFTLVIPLLKTLPEIIALTIISWVAVAIDYIAEGWGGAYTIIPIAALALHARGFASAAPDTALTPNATSHTSERS